MIIGLSFWILTLSSCAYAWCCGGVDGRIAAAMIVTASILSIPAAGFGSHFDQTEDAILAVDLALLIGLYALSLFSRRFFVLWMVGFHLVAVISHFSTMLLPEVAANIYRALSSFWALPIALAMFLGIRADRRAGLFTSNAGAAPGDPNEQSCRL